MHDPFKISQPTCISFSGGRTSAYLLWRVLQANGGLPADTVVCFANTGKEVEATLRFVRDCAEHWQVPIHWLEYVPTEPGFALVDFDQASRQDLIVCRKAVSSACCAQIDHATFQTGGAGDIKTVGEFHSFRSRADALAEIKRLHSTHGATA